MTTLLDPTLLVWPRLTALRDCLCEAANPQLCQCTVLPGELVSIDYCTECSGGVCGQGWVRLESAFPSTVFPMQDTDATLGRSCGKVLAITVELGMVRCAPVGDAQGNPPSTDQWEAASIQQMTDMAAMRTAIQCCFPHELTVLGAYTPVGPAGGCVGGHWSVAVSPEGF